MTIGDYFSGLGRKALFLGGLATLLLPTFGCSEYRGAGDYSCEKYGNMITARKGSEWARMDKEFSFFGDCTIKIDYDSKIPREEALKAIDACVKSFDEEEVKKPQVPKSVPSPMGGEFTKESQ